MSADLKFEFSNKNDLLMPFYQAEINNCSYLAKIEECVSINRYNGGDYKSNEFISANKHCLVFSVYCNGEVILDEAVDFSPNEFSEEQKHKTLKACLRNWLKAHAEVFLTASIEDEY